jgi:3-hydroxyacyl-[acyl-carrier-protein] dehydratase
VHWIWIDRILELKPGERLVAIKNVTSAEDHLHDHFAAGGGLPAEPVMPASLIVEGMAQTAGILVGHTGEYKEKVILAKITSVVLECDVIPGDTIRYSATLERIDKAGATTSGTVECRGAGADEWKPIGTIDLLFSHVDNNISGLEFPEHNFVFTEAFRTLLERSGINVSF